MFDWHHAVCYVLQDRHIEEVRKKKESQSEDTNAAAADAQWKRDLVQWWAAVWTADCLISLYETVVLKYVAESFHTMQLALTWSVVIDRYSYTIHLTNFWILCKIIIPVCVVVECSQVVQGVAGYKFHVFNALKGRDVNWLH